MKNIIVIAKPRQKRGCGNLFYFKCILLVVIMFGFFSCSENPETYIQHVEGYWEIEEVTMADGHKKEYKFNETIDYISVNDSLKGFRKKLKPVINDTYFTSADAETLELKIENNKLNIYYSTPYANWKETVLEATSDQLRILNEDENIYVYKRYTPIKLDLEE
ncbi:lipocalin family protein [Winogradskyella forsetii]|uniref:lipocalin family protein n=1 Tax=Winogradskyella forsetii TaxID=2686077 RepID=UPI002117A0EF|nr:lipocalin family protein [Winogradskyella forsetii]